MKLILPVALEQEIARAAITAFPRECCGLVEGARVGDDFSATHIHPARNLAAGLDRFEIDPRDHIAAGKAARERGQRIIGCYHSHPNGTAEPSAHDLSRAGEKDFFWLIAATGGAEFRLAAFIYRDSGFAPVMFSRGADLVTSSRNTRG